MKAKRWITILVVAAVLIAAGIWYTNTKKKATEAMAVQDAFEAVTVSRGDIVQSITATGTVQLADQVNVRPLITGKVKAILVQPGNRVSAGQTLLLLDDSDVQDRLAQAKEALIAAEARVSKTKKDQEILPTQLDAQVQSAKASLASAQLKLKQLKEGTKPEEIDQQRAAVNQAKINQDSAEADYKRFKELYAAGAVSRQQFESTETKYLSSVEALRSAQRRLDLMLAPPDADDVAAAEAQIAQAKANLRLAEANLAAGSSNDQIASAQSQLVQARVAYDKAKDDLSSTRLVSPISGVVEELLLTSSSRTTSGSTTDLGVGDTISPETGVVTISNPDTTEVKASVDETDIAGVRVGLPAIVTVDAFEGREFRGRVTNIAPSGSNTDGVVTFDVTVAVPQGAGLKTGMTADVEIVMAQQNGVLILPKEAVVQRRGRPMVQVSKTGDSRFKRVETGVSDDTNIEIVSGLDEGDTVLIEKAAPQASGSNGPGGGQGGGQSGGQRSGGMMVFGGPRR